MVNQKGKAILALILIVILLVAGSFYLGRYTKTQDLPQPSPSPIVETILVASPSVSDLPLVNPFDQGSAVSQAKPTSSPIMTKADVEIREEADGKVYTDNKHGFSFKFSKTLTLNNSASDANFAQFLEFQPGTGNVARMVMQIFENPNNSSLEEVVKREGLLSVNNDIGPKYEYSTVGGREAVKLTKVMTQNEMCNDGDSTTKTRVFNFLVKGDKYVFEIHPNNSCESFKRNWFDITPASFNFN